MSFTDQQLQQAFAAFDAANREDPNTEVVAGQAQPKELVYAQRMSQQLNEFCGDASPVVQLAARAQHICRWKIPRTDYPMDRPGYHRWRTELGRFHADTAAAILAKQGVDSELIERVKTLLQKRKLKQDPEVQLLEDVVCLVFIRHYLADFARKHDEEKLLDIIRKTWKKMSPKGQEAALSLALPEDLTTLITRAVAPDSDEN
jgi:hypothetical protein